MDAAPLPAVPPTLPGPPPQPAGEGPAASLGTDASPGIAASPGTAEPGNRAPHPFRSRALLVAVGIAVLLAARLLEFEPPRSLHLPILGWQLPESCSFRRHFGWDCAGCGMTRSFVLAAHGQWRDAAAMHPIGFLGFVVLVLVVLGRSVELLRMIVRTAAEGGDAGPAPPRLGGLPRWTRGLGGPEAALLALLSIASLIWWLLRAMIGRQIF